VLGPPGGGLSIQVRLAVDGRGRPLAALLSGGQTGDDPYLLPVRDEQWRDLATRYAKRAAIY
jgi:hypothetical protein